MATAASRGSSVVTTTGTTWATTNNAFDGAVGTTPATYATFTNAASGGVGTIVIGGYFGAGSVDVGATPSAISAVVRHFEGSPTSRWTSVTAQLQDSTGAAIGTAQTVALQTGATSTTITPSVVPTAAQINAGLRMLITATHSGTTSSVFSLDYVDITVTYAPLSPPGATLSITGGTPILTGITTTISPPGASLAITMGTPIVTTMLGLSDDFSTKDTTKWTWANANTVQGSGQIFLKADPTTNGNLYSPNAFNMTGKSVQIEALVVPSVPGNTGVSILCLMSSISTFDTYYGMGYSGTSLFLRYQIAGTANDIYVPWDAKAHRFWRIREGNGNVYYDTSPDSITWTNQRIVADNASIPVTALYPCMFAFDSVANGYWADFDNFNIPVSPCAKIATLVDNFNTKDTTKWSWDTGASVSGGQLVCNVALNYPGEITSAIQYDLTGSSFLVQLAQLGGANCNFENEIFMSPAANSGSPLSAAPSNGVQFGPVSGDSGVTKVVNVYGFDANGTPTLMGGTGPVYSATNHKWLRIRESGGTVYFEASPDTISWTTIYSGAWPAAVGGGSAQPIDRLYFAIQCGLDAAGTPTPANTLWDNVNNPPILIQPTVAPLSITGGTPLVTFGTLIKPTGATLSITGGTPLVAAPRLVQPTGAALTLTTGTPLVSAPVLVQPPGVTLTLTTGTPLVVAPRLVTPPGATPSITGGTPLVATPRLVQPPGAALTLTTGTPLVTVSGTSNVVILPTGATMTLTTGTPLVSAAVVATPGGASLSITGGIPTVLTPTTVQPPGAMLSITTGTPLVVKGTVVLPTAATLSLTGGTPLVRTPRLIQPVGDTLTITGGHPRIALGGQPALIMNSGSVLLETGGTLISTS